MLGYAERGSLDDWSSPQESLAARLPGDAGGTTRKLEALRDLLHGYRNDERNTTFGMIGTESGFELAGCTTYTSESTAERLSDEELNF